LSETDGDSVLPAFSSLYFTLFISDLPYSAARPLFEAFLVLGEKDFLTKLLFKALTDKAKEILRLPSFEVISYLRNVML
jgi:hypothetical protein